MTKNIRPDIAVFGKALGNGYPISAILGKKEVMDVAEETFISSTFFTERIGFTAGIETLNQMKKTNAQEKLKDFGKKIKEGWSEISEKYKVAIDVSGIDPLAHFDFKNDENKEKMTYFIYSMLYSGFLAGPSTYTTTAYSDKIISKYENKSKTIFIGDSEEDYKSAKICGIDFLLKLNSESKNLKLPRKVNKLQSFKFIEKNFS